MNVAFSSSACGANPAAGIVSPHPGAAVGSTHSVGTSDTSASGRPRTGTLRRSCECCRALKARCVLESSEPGSRRRCRRCASHGLECTFEEALARPKRPRPLARTRVKDVEEKLDSLIALVAARNGTTTAEKSTDLLPLNPPRLMELSPLSPGNSLFTGFEFPVSPPNSELALSTIDVFSRGIVSFEEGERLLKSFATEGTYMPFVALASHMTLDFLRRERPCLLLAILVSFSDSPLQDKLANEFRQLIAQTVIVDAKKNIDIVQGLIIFCVWHHRCINPNVHQLYQLTQLAVSMAVDLGLPHLAQISNMDLQKVGMARGSREHNPQYWDELERIRTYLGCYYVSHCISISMRKPTHLKHTRRIEEAAKLISSIGQTEWDGQLLYRIRFQHFAEEVERVFQYHDPDGMEDMDGFKIHTMVKTFERRLAQLKEATPPEMLENISIKLEILFLRIYINEVAMKTPPGHDGKPLCCSWCSSAYRTDLAVSCVRAAQAYADACLALSDGQLRSLNVVEVGRHLYAVLVLGRVAMVGDVIAGWEVSARGELTRLGHYLEASQRRTASVVRLNDDGHPRQDMFWMLNYVLTQAAQWHSTWIKNPGIVEFTDPDLCEISVCFDMVLGNRPPEKAPPEVQQQPTPESAWMGDPEVMWPNMGFSPPADWFDI